MTTTSDRSVVMDSLGVSVAVGLYGISFGAIATSSGLSIWQACLLSIPSVFLQVFISYRLMKALWGAGWPTICG